ncbi:hypothetical protein IB229_16685 [Pseudomonas sp. PDM14]|uniref:hypothetical protein n=1 Tax=Pseudomonas sp. PDM14 TaxID=2769288 RepID=UPI001785AB32|nr:hypothetical protein [Pseudomonas sp. PDM14]MBD9484618.1 hypothetical protein [Pseudomonas sp. PDM14]
MVGVEEIASVLHNLSMSLPGAVSVCLFRNPYYSFKYEYSLGTLSSHVSRFILGPFLLGFFAARYRKFIYVGGNGFLFSQCDGRFKEFEFIKKRGGVIVCYFTGSEIRSFKLLNAYAKQRHIDVITTYQPISSRGIDSPVKEERRKALALSADKFADVIFNPSTDQMSYMSRETFPFLYFYPDENIRRAPCKWKDTTLPVIVHAPSSPLIKGTPLVRAAIKKLMLDGYDFEYIELIGVPHSTVLETINRAHIVLNEFYAFVPGVFGVEAMAANAVLLTSADRGIEPTLFEGANEAWVVTPYWMIYENLKLQLDHPDALQDQADRGTSWVREYCSYSASSARFREYVDA